MLAGWAQDAALAVRCGTMVSIQVDSWHETAIKYPQLPGALCSLQRRSECFWSCSGYSRHVALCWLPVCIWRVIASCDSYISSRWAFVADTPAHCGAHIPLCCCLAPCERSPDPQGWRTLGGPHLPSVCLAGSVWLQQLVDAARQVAQDAGGALKLLVQDHAGLPVHGAPQVVRQLEGVLWGGITALSQAPGRVQGWGRECKDERGGA